MSLATVLGSSFVRRALSDIRNGKFVSHGTTPFFMRNFRSGSINFSSSSSVDNLTIGFDPPRPPPKSRRGNNNWEERTSFVRRPSRTTIFRFNQSLRHHIDTQNIEGAIHAWKQLKEYKKSPNLQEYTEMLKALVVLNQRAEVI